ncbi:MAG: uncharacterized protein K0S11_170 [Gammaproteobacteria bacterium]|jgi:ankyrin repeat protein|nr:uncharacterized protein [Gammaproteobacteria bacterium]
MTQKFFDAVKSGNYAKVSTLLVQDANLLTATNNDSETALHIAADYNQIDIAHLLLNKNAQTDVKDKDNNTPLMAAVKADNDAIIKILVKANPRLINALDTHGCTPIIYAIENDNEAVCELLIRNGADVEATNDIGNKPLHIAAENGFTKIGQILLDNNAKINAYSTEGKTAYHYAVKHAQDEFKKMLVARGADITLGTRPVNHQPFINQSKVTLQNTQTLFLKIMQRRQNLQTTPNKDKNRITYSTNSYNAPKNNF